MHVNAAYTSQACHRCGRPRPSRGDRLHCTLCGVVWQADRERRDQHPAQSGDPDIALHTPHKRVKQILQERTDRHRIRLPIQDSSQHTGRRAKHPNCSTMSNE